MKKYKKNSLITSIGFFLLGIFIFMNPDVLVKIVSYAFGGILIALGLYKIANYYIQDKRLGIVNHHELAFGITSLVLGVVFIFLADAIVLLLRFIVGGWLILAGVSKIFKTFFTTSRDSKFYALIIIGLILISIGLYIVFVSNIPLSIIGLFMMMYGLTDFISYFVYRENIADKALDDENVSHNLVTKGEIIEEAVFEEKVEKSPKKSKKKTNK